MSLDKVRPQKETVKRLLSKLTQKHRRRKNPKLPNQEKLSHLHQQSELKDLGW